MLIVHSVLVWQVAYLLFLFLILVLSWRAGGRWKFVWSVKISCQIRLHWNQLGIKKQRKTFCRILCKRIQLKWLRLISSINFGNNFCGSTDHVLVKYVMLKIDAVSLLVVEKVNYLVTYKKHREAIFRWSVI